MVWNFDHVSADLSITDVQLSIVFVPKWTSGMRITYFLMFKSLYSMAY